MKRFLKNNILIIVIMVIVSILLLNGGYKSLQEYKGYVNADQQLIKECEKEGTNQKEWCEEAIKNKDVELDFYTVFADALTWQVQYIYYFAFLIVVIPTMIKVCKKLKYKQIINSNSRESYHSFLKKLLKTAYQYIWVLALLSLIMMIPIMMYTSLNPEYAIIKSHGMWQSNIIYHPVLFVISYLINVTLYSMIFVHIALLVARKQQKTIPCIIISYVLYLAIEIFLETVVKVIIFQRIFHSEFGMIFNIINVFGMNDLYGVGTLLLLNLCMVLISFALVYLAYKNKEKFVIQCEKNK